MLRINRISDYEGFESQKELWRDLLTKSKIDNVFLTYEWIDACIRHLYKDERLLILDILDGDTLVGIAPLVIRRYKYFGLPVKVVSFIGTVTSDRMDFVLNCDKEEAIFLVLDYLMDIEKEWDFIDLQEIADYTGSTEIIEKWLNKEGVKNIIGPSKKSFFIRFNENGDYIFEGFTRKLQKELKKVNKEIGTGIEFVRYLNGEIKTERLFSDLRMIESRSWKGRKKSGIFSREDSASFHKDIFSKFLSNGWLDIAVLSLNNIPIAYTYNYLYRRRSYNYSIAFDERYSNISPGTVLMLWTLRDCALKDIAEFDFVRGEDNWKTRYTVTFKIHSRVRIFKNSAYSSFLYYLQSKFMPYMKSKRTLYTSWMRSKEILGWR